MVKIRWDIHRWETEYFLHSLHDYMEMTDDQFDKVRKAERQRLPQKPRGVSDEDFADWQSEIQFYEERYEKDFPSKIRYSFVVLLQIIIETRMRATCNEMSKRNGFLLKESDLKGAPIIRAKAFLKKVAQIQVKQQKTWQELNDLQKIRDCIVHTSGHVASSRDNKRLTELSKKGIGISISDAGIVEIDHEYCIRALKTARTFFEELYDAGGFGPSIPIVE